MRASFLPICLELHVRCSGPTDIKWLLQGQCFRFGVVRLEVGIRGVRRADTNKTTETADDSKLFVTRYILAPGAPLNSTVEGRDILIVGMNNGELLDEKRSPRSNVTLTNGSVILMPKEQLYLLRNIGKQSLELLVIEVRN